MITVVDNGQHIGICLEIPNDPSSCNPEVPQVYQEAIQNPLPYSDWELYVAELMKKVYGETPEG